MEIDPLEKVETLVREMHETMHKRTLRVHERYPLLFLLMTTFSVAATLHGFDKIMDHVPVLVAHPEYMLAVGLFGLFITGGLYNRLGKPFE